MSTVGQAEGIDHGSMRGYRQHHRRKVTMCDLCLAAKQTDDDEKASVDKSAKHAWNANRSTKQPAGARAVTAAREPTAWEKRKTARLLASRAADRDDLRELLAAAGVTAADGLAVLEPS